MNVSSSPPRFFPTARFSLQGTDQRAISLLCGTVRPNDGNLVGDWSMAILRGFTLRRFFQR